MKKRIKKCKSDYINLFYEGQMHPNFQKDESAITKIIRRYITTTDPEKKLRFIIYYRKFRTTNLIIKNNSSPKPKSLQETSVIYQFICPMGICNPLNKEQNGTYIGLTTTTLSRRLTYHLNEQSSIYKHLSQHKVKPSEMRKILVDNTKIIDRNNKKKKLIILEALHIKKRTPSINRINFQTGANVLSCL